MVRLEVLLPVLLEDDNYFPASTSQLVGIQPLIDELADHGITTDAELLFSSTSANLSIEAVQTLETLDVRNKIANFLAAEASTGDDLYRQVTGGASAPSTAFLSDDLCSTGTEGVDRLLGGGWHGEVVELLGETGVGKTWFVLRTVLRHLYDHPEEQALWLDTTASFSAEWADQILQSVMKSPAEDVALQSSIDEAQEHLSMQRSDVLDRLIVAKVFDLQSAIQAVQQVRNQRRSIRDEVDLKREERQNPGANMAGDPEAVMYSNEVPETGHPAVTFVRSSVGLSGSACGKQESGESNGGKSAAPKDGSTQLPLRFIVIDSVTALLKGVLSATSAEGHARMLSFMRLLRSLATTPAVPSEKITVFVVNNFVSLASTANSTAALHSVFPALNAKKFKAALGPTFTYLTDWTIYLSHVRDVFPQYGLGDNASNERQEGVIFEVIRSRRMPQGRWALL